VTAADFEFITLVNMEKTTPAEFVQMVLKDIKWDAETGTSLFGPARRRRRKKVRA
jgi:hypothetical protein